MAQERSSNASNVEHGLAFLRALVLARCGAEYGSGDAVEVPDLAFYGDGSELAELLERREPTWDEYVVLLLALLPHVAPGFLDRVVREALPGAGDYPEMGGRRGLDGRALVATGETAVFLLAGTDLERRFTVQRLFLDDHWFARDGVLRLEAAPAGESALSGRIVLEPDAAQRLTSGDVEAPRFSPEFPAREIRTELEWDDVVLSDEIRREIADIQAWIEHNDILMNEWKMRRKLKPGYRTLFHGGPGTGKTLTATLLGKYTGRPVYAVDSALLTSKYVGETSRNLAALFDRASHRDWILFFDEADALFAKRTEVQDSHDKYANQEIAYLLQRLETFDGLVILASNLKNNMDEAFLRRFNKVVSFPFPAREERAQIWKKLVPERFEQSTSADLFERFAEYGLAGGSITNVVQHACLRALARGIDEISEEDLHAGVRAEFEKEGRAFQQLDLGAA
jgi:AAA+ superfamily predicted ATPase